MFESLVIYRFGKKPFEIHCLYLIYFYGSPLVLKPGEVVELPPLPEDSSESEEGEGEVRPAGPEKQSFIEERRSPES